MLRRIFLIDGCVLVATGLLFWRWPCLFAPQNSRVAAVCHRSPDAITDSGVLNIAFVDDHKVVTHALRSFFQSFSDIRVVGIASSGEELLTRLSEWTAADVVVLDLMMPGGIDGIETMRRLLQRFPKIRVVALTASTDDARMTAVLRAGATGYVRKDAESELLLKAVRAVADGRSFVDPSATGATLVGTAADELSPREIDVLREVAFGRTIVRSANASLSAKKPSRRTSPDCCRNCRCRIGRSWSPMR
jgi:two-component system, NarL family, response regulator LiaR